MMKAYLYIALVLLLVACQPPNKPTKPIGLQQMDSVYTQADFRAYGDYYNSHHQVYAIDLLSEGLEYDSLWHISGTGCNLFLSDVFVHGDSVKRLPAGVYEMDTVAREMSFLRGMHFESNVTGSYLLAIEEDKIERIVLFTTGRMRIDYEGEDVVIDLELYTADSARYHAMYQGAAMYR
jgi:hypothetical protein